MRGALTRRSGAVFWNPNTTCSSARAITVPTLVVSGRRDPVIPAAKDGRYAAAAIPGARQVLLDCGHAVFAERPAEFLAEASRFWNGLGLGLGLALETARAA